MISRHQQLHLWQVHNDESKSHGAPLGKKKKWKKKTSEEKEKEGDEKRKKKKKGTNQNFLSTFFLLPILSFAVIERCPDPVDKLEYDAAGDVLFSEKLKKKSKNQRTKTNQKFNILSPSIALTCPCS